MDWSGTFVHRGGGRFTYRDESCRRDCAVTAADALSRSSFRDPLVKDRWRARPLGKQMRMLVLFGNPVRGAEVRLCPPLDRRLAACYRP
jgi:hypothetical protein